MRPSTRPVSGLPAIVADRVNLDGGQHLGVLDHAQGRGAQRGAGQQVVDVVEGQQADQVGGVGVVQVHV